MKGWRTAAIVWTLLIVGLCTIPGQDLPKVDIISADKIGHFLMFLVFGWLWLSTGRRRSPRHMIGVLIFGCAFAGLTEIYQGLLPFGREPDVFDVAANAAGLFAAAVCFRVVDARRAGRQPGS